MTLSPQITMFQVQQNVRVLLENAYSNALADRWAMKVLKELPSVSAKENLFWLIQSGCFGYSTEGTVEFVEQAIMDYTVSPKFLGAPALKLLKSDFDDLDSKGFGLAAQWAQKTGVEYALFPQLSLATSMIANPKTYDGLTFFNTAHLLNPKDASAGTYANVFTGAASGSYPGALPLTPDQTGINNLTKALAYIRSVPAPNGKVPRRLKPKYLVVPPALESTALIVTDAKFVTGTAGGATDVSLATNRFGLEVVVAVELGSTYGGSDTDYFIVCEDVGTQLGAYVYVNREPLDIQYFGPQNSAEMARLRTHQWTATARADVAAGHPFLMFKGSAT